jgi:DNA-directed RNA polymerase specialized sigma24 family protein
MENVEQSWLTSLAAGDEQAFRNIYYRYWKTIYQASHRFLKSPDLAKDVVTKVFPELWKRRAEFADVKEMRDFMIITSRDLTYEHLKEIARAWQVGEKPN